VHGLCSTPWDGHFFRHFGPHLCFESFIQPSKLVLLILIPLAAAFKVVLVVKTATDGAATWQAFADILPLHTTASQLDDQGIFLW
jgi:hypothetical protein